MINVMFTSENSLTGNVFLIRYDEDKVENKELFELMLMEEIIKGEYPEDFLDMDMKEMAIGKIFANEKFYNIEIEFGEKEELVYYDPTYRTYLLNTNVAGDLELGIYEENEDTGNYKSYSPQEFLKKYNIEKKYETALPEGELKEALGFSLAGNVAEFINENTIDDRKEKTREFGESYTGVIALDYEELNSNLQIFANQKLEDFKDKYDIKNEDQFWEKLEEDNLEILRESQNGDQQVIIKIDDDLEFILEYYGNEDFYTLGFSADYTHFKEEGNNKTLLLTESAVDLDKTIYIDEEVFNHYQKIVEYNKQQLINEYKEKIENSTDFHFLNAIQQITLGWNNTPDVLNMIPERDMEELMGNKDLFIDSMNQIRAINYVKDEKIKNSEGKVLTKEDVEVSQVEVFLKKKDFKAEDIEKVYKSQMKLVSVNKNNLSEGELFEDNRRIKNQIKPAKNKFK